ncbi:hypothetical protein [Paenibacillus agaridevorans]|nr:hypothetical protein [Paenibacillus agaridevorans]
MDMNINIKSFKSLSDVPIEPGKVIAFIGASRQAASIIIEVGEVK